MRPEIKPWAHCLSTLTYIPHLVLFIWRLAANLTIIYFASDGQIHRMPLVVFDWHTLLQKTSGDSELYRRHVVISSKVLELAKRHKNQPIPNPSPSHPTHFQEKVSLEPSHAKCSTSCDLIAIAICDSNREPQITSDLRQREPSQKSPLH